MRSRIDALILVVTVSLAGCHPAQSPTSAEEERTVEAPAASEVESIVEASYRAPERHGLTLRADEKPRSGVLTWDRLYDGVPMRSEVKSVLGDDGRWETRFIKELAEPEPVRENALLSDEEIARVAGLDQQFRAGAVSSRLVYVPVIESVPNKSVVKNAADVDRVITRYRLTQELVEAGTNNRTWVDAYSGEIVERAPGAVADRVVSQGFHYPSVTLDLTKVATGTAYLLRDPVRASYLDASGKPINGQGVAQNLPKDELNPLTYYVAGKAGVLATDTAFAMQESWDFFAAAFGRRGLRDLAPGPGSTANEGIVVFDTNAANNAQMYQDKTGHATGVIGVNTLTPAGVAYMTLQILGHEWAHGVFSAAVGPTGQYGEDGGVDEADSDIFGEVIRARGRAVMNAQSCLLCSVPPIVPIPDPPAGWIHGNEDPEYPAEYLRYMCRPSDNADLDTWVPEISSVERHYAMGPINRMFCLLTRGILPNGSVGGDSALKTSVVPNGFTGLGTEKAIRLWYAALPILHSYPAPFTFLNTRTAALLAAASLYGQYSQEYKAVEDAFAAILVGAVADRDPPMVTLGSATIGIHNPVTVNATDASGVKSVSFALDGASVGFAVAAPPVWQVMMPSTLTGGTHTLAVTAIDTHLNSKTYNFTVTADVAPPTITLTDVTTVSPANQHQRMYKVTASDSSGITNLSLRVDGPPVGSVSSVTSYTFTVPFTVGGQHYIAAYATDQMGNVGSKAGYFAVDLSPPNWVSGPTYTEDHNTQGHITMAFCGSDTAGVPKASLQVDGQTMGTVTQTSSGCFSVDVKGLTLGTHQYVAHLYDGWGNDRSSAQSDDVIGVYPTVGIPNVVIDTMNAGHIAVATTYSSPSGIHQVNLRMCWSAQCQTVSFFYPQTTADQTSHIFDVTGLTPGQTYFAQVSVCGNNAPLCTDKNSDTFTIPTPDVVYTEQRANDVWQAAEGVPAGTNVIRGATSGGDEDWYFMYLSPGQSLCVAGAITNNNHTCTTSVTLYINNQGWPAGGASSQLVQSRSAISTTDYVCMAAPAAPNNYVLVNVEGPGFGGCSLTYDVLLQTR